MIWATVAFLVAFLLISSSSRALFVLWLGQAGKWIGDWAPFSYLIIFLAVAASIVPVYLMMHWPHRVEPVNPMEKYKHDDVMPD